MDENKKRALAAALAQIDKQFGKGTVMLMGDKSIGLSSAFDDFFAAAETTVFSVRNAHKVKEAYVRVF